MTMNTPDEPQNLNAHTRLREQVINLMNQVWIEGKKDTDGVNKYADLVLQSCGEEAKKVLPAEYAQALDELFVAKKA